MKRMIGGCLLLNGALGEKSQEKPNIVLILADDMGWGDIYANGNNLVKHLF